MDNNSGLIKKPCLSEGGKGFFRQLLIDARKRETERDPTSGWTSPSSPGTVQGAKREGSAPSKIERERLIREREIELLRWKCLIRSDIFIAAWQYALTSVSNSSTPRSEQSQFKSINIAEGTRIPPTIFTTVFRYLRYVPFDNPENETFDKYWSRKEEWRKSEKYQSIQSTMKSVEDYREMISQDIDIVAKHIREKENREPSIDELKDSLVNWWMGGSYFTYLKITQRAFTFQEADEITKQISCILKRRIPKKRFVIEEMDRYLRVYDQRINKGKRKKWKDVCRELYPKSDFAGKRLELISDFKKAKRMIEHAENDMPL